jgi:hypothetical protein
MVDARRAHLARMGLDARHADALRMPEPERATAPPVHADALPEPNTTAPRKRPALAGVDFGIGGPSDDDPQVGGAAGRRSRAAGPQSGQIDVGDGQ